MKAIHIKLWRDLTRLRAQVATIAMVVAIGVAGFVGMFSVHDSLQGARDTFYHDNRLADVFASVKRAPVHLRAAAGGDRRCGRGASSTWSSTRRSTCPAWCRRSPGRFIGLDLARVHAGSPGPERAHAQARALARARRRARGAGQRPVRRGAHPEARRHRARHPQRQAERGALVGTAVTPEYVFASQGGAPDDESFGIWWIDGDAHDDAFDCRAPSTRWRCG